LTDEIAIIQTVDIFTPVVDNPYDYGQIVAANSLSDVYAMGGKPVTALNILGYHKRNVSSETVAEILKGAIDKVKEADCVIVGGHTINDDELKYGLSVTGVIHPGKIITNSNAKTGDKLILTKPLGLGILSTALKSGNLNEEAAQKITGIMSQLNKIAAETMSSFEAHSATDITGFGLIGHAYEMASGSNVGITLYADKIPYLPETLDKIKDGNIPGGTYDNKKYLRKHVTFSGTIDINEQLIFFDAQTSGGLLISILPKSADAFVKLLHEKGITDAAVIGEITGEKAGKIDIVK